MTISRRVPSNITNMISISSWSLQKQTMGGSKSW